ncbi:transposase (plasmid) [Escherichia coli]|nr:insertion element IS1 5 protein insB [Escherichia coli KTE195]BBQ59915.1 transposase [Escherichia coli]BBV32888.1 transposase [Citrobacter freundii]BBV37888.1 transposase [Citrobacter freundii]GCX95073.1 IS1 family transposase InsB [Escherichia coli]
MDEQWGYVGAKSRQRWLFYAYDRLRKTVVAHVFGERTMATLGRLMSLLSPFDVVIWMTDGWPLYESRLKGKLHVISKRYTQRIERHNLNLRQHLARLGRKSLSFSKSVELHDKVIGHYRGLTLSGTKTHVKQRFLPLTPLLMVSDVLWSPVLPA